MLTTHRFRESKVKVCFLRNQSLGHLLYQLIDSIQFRKFRGFEPRTPDRLRLEHTIRIVVEAHQAVSAARQSKQEAAARLARATTRQVDMANPRPTLNQCFTKAIVKNWVLISPEI